MRERASDSGSNLPRPFGWDLVFGKLILIFQMPKTGSQTVEASLHQCSLPHRIVRCHFLSAGRIEELRDVLRRPGAPTAWKKQIDEQIKTTIRLSVGLRLRTMLRLCGFSIPKLEIITAVREPIGLALSAIFQNYLYFAPTPQALTLDSCREILQRPKMFTSLDQWFDSELRPLVGIDVYANPFQSELGWRIYENARARVLLYRFEALPQLENILSHFMGCHVPRVVNRNLSNTKDYGPCYQDVQKHLRLPRDFVLRRYLSKLARHFYSPRELANLVQRWCDSEPEANDPFGNGIDLSSPRANRLTH